MIVDSHHHLWRLAAGSYDFPRPDDPVLYRDFWLSDLEAECDAASVDHTIVVQATAAQWETLALLEAASRSDRIAGVVGWCDLQGGSVGTILESFANAGPLVGVRPILQAQDDIAWILSDAARANMDCLVETGLAFDALVDTRHLPVLDAFARQNPDLTIIIDHMAKPWRYPEMFAQWGPAMQAIAALPNCSVKFSGFPFGQDPAGRGLAYPALFENLRDWFGPDRMLWGSDWPVSTRHAPYPRVLESAIQPIHDSERARLLADNARRLYRLSL